jgi:L-threonylcarbamoyladenylate synthase
MDTVAVRIPQHPIALALLRTSRLAIAAPSANRYMELSPTRAEHVQKSLGDRVDMILDGGPTEVGIESTVVSLLGEHPLILRPGMIDEEQLSQVVPGIGRALPETLHDEIPRHSPGLAVRHYAPQARLVVIKGSREAFEGQLKHVRSGERKGVLVLGGEPLAGKEIFSCQVLPGDPQGYARGLYGALHDLDALDVKTIYVQGPPDEPEWAAIWDRLDRAAVKD